MLIANNRVVVVGLVVVPKPDPGFGLVVVNHGGLFNAAGFYGFYKHANKNLCCHSCYYISANGTSTDPLRAGFAKAELDMLISVRASELGSEGVAEPIAPMEESFLVSFWFVLFRFVSFKSSGTKLFIILFILFFLLLLLYTLKFCLLLF